MSWTKADGAKIKITFDRPIVSGQTGQQSFFTVTVPEYTFAPGGTIQNVTKTVKSTYTYGTTGTVDLANGTLTDTFASDGVLSLGVA